jgi:hypothetical protein
VSGRSQTYSELLKIKNRIVVPDKGVAKYIEALRCRYRTYHYLTKIGLVVWYRVARRRYAIRDTVNHNDDIL